MKQAITLLAAGMLSFTLAAQTPASSAPVSNTASKRIHFVSGDHSDDYASMPAPASYHSLAQKGPRTVGHVPEMYRSKPKEHTWAIYWQKLPKYSREKYTEISPYSTANNTPELEMMYTRDGQDVINRSNNPCAPYPCDPNQLSERTSTLSGQTGQPAQLSSQPTSNTDNHNVNNDKPSGGSGSGSVSPYKNY